MSIGFQNSFSEAYNYTTLDDGGIFYLRGDPVFVCDFESADDKLPNAGKELMMLTQESVLEWQSHLKQTTNQLDRWNFKYIPVNIAQQESFDDSICHVVVTYQREPPEEYRFEDLGATEYFWDKDNNFYFADIEIYYTLLEFETKQELENYENHELSFQFESPGYSNQLSPDIKETIIHELGHALGLDHVEFDESEFDLIDGIYFSPSIMVEPYKISLENQKYVITQYDINAIVNLYGQDGFAELQDESDASQNLMLILLIIAGIMITLVVLILFKKRR